MEKTILCSLRNQIYQGDIRFYSEMSVDEMIQKTLAIFSLPIKSYQNLI